MSLELLQETLVEARAGRMGLWESLAAPTLKEKGRSAKKIARLFDAQTEEAKGFSYGLAGEIKSELETEEDSTSDTADDEDRQGRLVYDPTDSNQNTDPAVALDLCEQEA